MSTWVDVNGARIEKQFLEENIQEAHSYVFEKVSEAELQDHVHCMICMVAVDETAAPIDGLYKSQGGFVCAYCHSHFLR